MQNPYSLGCLHFTLGMPFAQQVVVDWFMGNSAFFHTSFFVFGLTCLCIEKPPEECMLGVL